MKSLDKVKELIEDECFPEAYKTCSEILSENENDADAMEMLAIILIESGLSVDSSVNDQLSLAVSVSE